MGTQNWVHIVFLFLKCGFFFFTCSFLIELILESVCVNNWFLCSFCQAQNEEFSTIFNLEDYKGKVLCFLFGGTMLILYLDWQFCELLFNISFVCVLKRYFFSLHHPHSSAASIVSKVLLFLFDFVHFFLHLSIPRKVLQANSSCHSQVSRNQGEP